MSSDLDKAMGASAPAAFGKTTPLGTRIGGVIVGEAQVRQMRKFRNGQPTDELDTWDNGDPKNQISVPVQTELRESGEDDGRRTLYIKTWGPQKEGLLAAVRAAGYAKLSEALAEGNQLYATYTHDDPARGTDTTPAKIFSYEIVRGSSGALDAAVSEAPAAQQAAPAPAQTVPSGGTNDKLEAAKQLIGLGLSDEEIATQVGMLPLVVGKLREQVSSAAPF